MSETSDEELVVLARAGDKDSFGELIDKHRPMARRVATGVVRDEGLAADLVQDALVQAYLSLDRLRDPERFRSWLYGIVLNVCRSYLRDMKTAPLSLEAISGGLRFEALPFAGGDPGPQEVAEAQELHRAVREAVGALSPRNRAATLLFYYDQLSVREVAASLGLSVAAVKTRLHRSRAELREELLRRYPDIAQRQEARKMIKVTIADLMSQEGTHPLTGEPTRQLLVALLDSEGRRLLPIWTSPEQGEAILIGLGDYQLPRPMAHNFIANILEALDARLEEVRVEALKDDTFYSVAKLSVGDKVREVDCRPSDAFALTVLTKSPIYVADEVMEKAGIAIPESVTDLHPKAKALGEMMAKQEQRIAETHRKAGKEGQPAEEIKAERLAEVQRAHEELLAYVFGGEEDEPASM